MLTNEDLLAISNVMDTKLKPIKEDIKDLKEDVVVLKQDVSDLKEDVVVLKQDVSDLKEDVVVLKQDVSDLKEDVVVLKQDVSGLKQDVHHVKLVLENDIRPRLQNIESCYVSTYQRYCEKTEQIDDVQADVVLLKGVAEEHGKMIRALSQTAM